MLGESIRGMNISECVCVCVCVCLGGHACVRGVGYVCLVILYGLCIVCMCAWLHAFVDVCLYECDDEQQEIGLALCPLC